MTKGVKITGVVIGSAIAGALLGLLWVGLTAVQGATLDDWVFYGTIGTIAGIIFCLLILITRKITRNKSKLVKCVSLVFVAILGSILAIKLAYVLSGILVYVVLRLE